MPANLFHFQQSKPQFLSAGFPIKPVYGFFRFVQENITSFMLFQGLLIFLGLYTWTEQLQDFTGRINENVCLSISFLFFVSADQDTGYSNIIACWIPSLK